MHRFLLSPFALLLVACDTSDDTLPPQEPVFEDFRGVFDVTAYEEGPCGETSDALDSLGERNRIVAYSVVRNLVELLRLSDCSSIDECELVRMAGLEDRQHRDEAWYTFTHLLDPEHAAGGIALGGTPTEDALCTGRTYDALDLERGENETMSFTITRYALEDAPLDRNGQCGAALNTQREEAEAAQSNEAGGAGGSGGAGEAESSDTAAHCSRVTKYTLMPIGGG